MCSIAAEGLRRGNTGYVTVGVEMHVVYRESMISGPAGVRSILLSASGRLTSKADDLPISVESIRAADAESFVNSRASSLPRETAT